MSEKKTPLRASFFVGRGKRRAYFVGAGFYPAHPIENRALVVGADDPVRPYNDDAFFFHRAG